jgi:tripartite-type tricarboxylate transporter receptor subunit TctC
MNIERTAMTTCKYLIPSLFSLLVGIAGTSTSIGAEEYPSRPIKIVVPVAAGGAPDVVTRLIGEKLTTSLKQPVIVENRPGAGERLGAEYVAKAAPDGYTLLATPPGPLVVAPHLYPTLPYDPAAFVAVSGLTRGHLVLVARQNMAATNARELVALAKTRPGTLKFASPGIGTPPHLTAEMFRLAAQIQVIHVPYKGLAPAVADLLAGHVDFMVDNLGNSLAHIKGGRLKALGIASEQRFAELPHVATIAETYPQVISTSWFGVVAPPKTPSPTADRLSKAIADALRQPDVVARLKAMAFVSAAHTPGEMAKFLRQERTRWGSVISASGAKPE